MRGEHSKSKIQDKRDSKNRLQLENNKKINKTKSWFFQKTDKINKLLARLTKKKREREKTQITNVIYGRGDITTYPMDTKRRIKEYFQQLYVYKFDNLDGND